MNDIKYCKYNKSYFKKGYNNPSFWGLFLILFQSWSLRVRSFQSSAIRSNLNSSHSQPSTSLLVVGPLIDPYDLVLVLEKTSLTLIH